MRYIKRKYECHSKKGELQYEKKIKHTKKEKSVR